MNTPRMPRPRRGGNPQRRIPPDIEARLRKAEAQAKRGAGAYRALALIVLFILLLMVLAVVGNVLKERRLREEARQERLR